MAGAAEWGDHGIGIAVDPSGNAYVTGFASSPDFPTTLRAFQATYGGDSAFWSYGGDAFVSKLNESGIVYTTYLGGSGSDIGYGIAVDASGNAYIAGTTGSLNFPTTPGALQPTQASGASLSAFVSKVNATGSALVYSTYLGGGYLSYGYGIAVDASGSTYITGKTLSWDFPTTLGAFQTVFRTGRGGDAFVTKLNVSGSALAYSTYLSGGDDQGIGIAVDGSGAAYVTGYAFSQFPTTPGAFQTTGGGGFVTKLNASGSALVYSTYGVGTAAGIAVDSSGNAYVAGTAVSGLPTTPGAFQPTYAGIGGWQYQSSYGDAFVAKFNASGSALVYCTYVGGSWPDAGDAIAVDALGNAYVTGLTYSSDFPTTPDGFPPASGLFVSKLNAAGSALLNSTTLGIGGGRGIAVDSSGNVYVTGDTSPDFLHISSGGGAFVAKLDIGPSIAPPATHAKLSGTLGNNAWYVSGVDVTLSASAASSPVSATYYSIDGGTYHVYVAPFRVSGDGAHQVSFYSVDAEGHQETPQEQTFKVDVTPPVSHVAPLPAMASSPNLYIQWSGTDPASGILSYHVFISDNGAPFTLFRITGAVGPKFQVWFAGVLGHTYGFYSAAQDLAGNVEVKTVADATATVPAQMPADTNGDGQINCTDIAVVKASFGKRTGQPGFDPRADVNHDGIVDVRDLAAVSQKLIPGTTCP